MRIFYFILFLSFSSSSFAWLVGNNTKIDSIVLWQDKSTMYFHTSAGFWCYIPPSEEHVKTLVLTAYTTKSSVVVHCHDKEETPMTFAPAHRFHRIIAR
jgi:hypothetical protein